MPIEQSSGYAAMPPDAQAAASNATAAAANVTAQGNNLANAAAQITSAAQQVVDKGGIAGPVADSNALQSAYQSYLTKKAAFTDAPTQLTNAANAYLTELSKRTALPMSTFINKYYEDMAKKDLEDIRTRVDRLYKDIDNKIILYSSTKGATTFDFENEVKERIQTLDTVVGEQHKVVATSNRKTFYENQQYVNLLGVEGTVRWIYYGLVAIIVARFVYNFFRTHQFSRWELAWIVFIALYPRLIHPMYEGLKEGWERFVSLLPSSSFITYSKL